MSDGIRFACSLIVWALLAAPFAASDAHAQGSFLDPTFGTDGVVVTDFGGTEQVNQVVTDAEGRVVVAVGGGEDFVVARYTADGTLDASFGNGGVATVDFGGTADETTSVAVLADGRILLGGTLSGGVNADYGLALFTATGALDASFGGDGLVTVDFGGDDYGGYVAEQADGKLLVAGASSGLGVDFDQTLARLNPDGTLDATFGDGGLVVTDFGGNDYVNAVAVDPSGRILVAGSMFGNGDDFGVARYNTDGSVDASFGSGGFVQVDIDTENDYANDLAVGADGSVILAGCASCGSTDSDFGLVRLTATGALDTTFGFGGVQTATFGASDDAKSVALFNDGRIVVAGATTGECPNDIAVLRFLASGAADTSFGQNGLVTTDVACSDDSAFDAAVQADGSVFIGGSGGTGADVVLARYLAEPMGDPIVPFATFDDGDVSSVGAFSESGGGVFFAATDGLGGAPATAFSASIDPAVAGAFAGFSVPTVSGVADVSSTSYLSFYLRPSALGATNLPLTLEINLHEDADGNGVYDGATEDEYQAVYRLAPGSEYALVQIPLASFTDDNAVFAGADDGFDFSQLFEIVFAVAGLQGPELTLDIDEMIFLDEPIALGGPFVDIETFDDGDVSDVQVFSETGGGVTLAVTEGADGASFSALSATIDPAAAGAFAGVAVPGAPGTVDVSATSYLSFSIGASVASSNVPYTLEINLQEDVDGNGTFDGATEDEYQAVYRVEPGTGYRLVQIPLASFTDDNAVFPGADDGFDFSRLLQVSFAAAGIGGTPFTLDLDGLGTAGSVAGGGPPSVTVRDLNAISAENISQLEALGPNATASEIQSLLTNDWIDVPVVFEAVLLTEPHSSGLASAPNGVPGRVHAFVRDTAAETDGPDGMTIQIVDSSGQLLGFDPGDVLRVEGALTPFYPASGGAAWQVSPLGAESISAVGAESLTQPWLQPVTVTTAEINAVVDAGQDLARLNWNAWNALNGQYVRVEGATVTDRDLGTTTGRPGFAVRSPGGSRLTGIDISLRYRNDRFDEYPNPPFTTRAQDDPFVPPVLDAQVDLQGFLVFQGVDPFASASPAGAVWNVAPFADSDLAVEPAGGIAVGNCAAGTAQGDLSISDVRAGLRNTGGLFFDSEAGYVVPKGSGRSPFFAASLWVGGLVGGDLRVAGATYGDFEFWPGPLGEGATLPNPDDCSTYDRIWTVNARDVDRYESTGEITADLAEWPADLGAPVLDGDGVANNYNLAGGDRPEIYGHEAAFWVMNDVGNVHASSGTQPIGLEVRVTAFSSAEDALDRHTFYRYELVNRSTQPLEAAHFGLFVDPDLGNAGDDYVGSDPERSLGFVYNSTNEDAEYFVPPAAGYDLLSGGGSVTYFTNEGAGSPTSDPTDGAGFYNYLQGRWGDGTPMTEGGTGYLSGGATTTWAFSGDPVTEQFWSEVNVDGNGTDNAQGDRRNLLASPGFSLAPGESRTFDVAMLYAQGPDHLASVTALRAASDEVQGLYDEGVLFAPSTEPPPPALPNITVVPSEFTIAEQGSFTVSSPASIAGTYAMGTAPFGGTFTPDFPLAEIVPVLDGSGTNGAGRACDSGAITNAAALAGQIALIERGDCTFTTKALHAQQAGAIAAVIYDNVPGDVFDLAGEDANVTIPAALIAQETGLLLLENLPAAGTIRSNVSNVGMVLGAGAFDVVNNGDEGTTLNVSSVIADPSWLTATPAGPFTLPVDQSQAVSVEVDWTQVEGTQTGTVTIASDASNAPTTVVSVTVIAAEEGGCALAWQVPLSATSVGSVSSALSFGQGPDATDGLDVACGEEELPPLPPEFEARFVLPDGSTGSLADYRSDSDGDGTMWRLSLNADDNDYPVALAWNPAGFPADAEFVLRDAVTGGSVFAVSMTTASSFTIENSGVTAVEIVRGPTDLTVPVPVAAGWNLVSVPVAATVMTPGALFPEATSSFFAYDGGYVSSDALENGRGYWAKFDATGSVDLTGGAVVSQEATVAAGWNLVGFFEAAVPVGGIGSTPDGLVTSSFFAYDGGYTTATDLEPGRAYWVKASGAGTLHATGSARVASRGFAQGDAAKGGEPSDPLEGAAVLTVTDAAERSVALYLAADETEPGAFVLPPVPPATAFDARLAGLNEEGDGRYAAWLGEGDWSLGLSGAAYPVTIALDGLGTGHLRITDGIDGSILDAVLEEGGTLTVDAALSTLALRHDGAVANEGGPLPTEFALAPAYPNPTSSTAKIPYELPESAHVRVVVYDVLGRAVAVLVDSDADAGRHEAILDTGRLAAGVYVVRMTAGSYAKSSRLTVTR